MRLLLVSLCCATPLALAAPLPAAYVDSLARIQDTLSSAQHTAQICRALHPALARSNDAAYARWQHQHQALLVEYAVRYRSYIRTLADNKPQLTARYMKIMDDKFRQTRTAREATLRHMPKAQSRALCHNYPAQLTSRLNPQTTLRQDFQRARLLRPLVINQKTAGLP